MEVVKRICDQVAVIDKGRLIEQGTVSEILSNPKTELAPRIYQFDFPHYLAGRIFRKSI